MKKELISKKVKDNNNKHLKTGDDTDVPNIGAELVKVDLMNQTKNVNWEVFVMNSEYNKRITEAKAINKHFEDHFGRLGHEIMSLMSMDLKHYNSIGHMYSSGVRFNGCVPYVHAYDVFKLIRFLVLGTKEHIDTKEVTWHKCGATLFRNIKDKDSKDFFFIEVNIDEVWENLEPIVSIFKCYAKGRKFTDGFSGYFQPMENGDIEHSKDMMYSFGFIIQNIIDIIDDGVSPFKWKSFVNKIYFKVYKPLGDTDIKFDINKIDIVSKLMFLTKYLYCSSDLFNTSDNLSIHEYVNIPAEWAALSLFSNKWEGDYTNLKMYQFKLARVDKLNEIIIYHNAPAFMRMFISFFEAGIKWAEKGVFSGRKDRKNIVSSNEYIYLRNTPANHEVLCYTPVHSETLDLWSHKLVIYTDVPVQTVYNIIKHMVK